jgi:hypothetical protein
MYYADFCCVGMHKHGQRCTDLLEITANALSGGAVALILLSIQKDNLELNIKQAIKWYALMHSRMRMRGAVPLQDP